MRVTTKDQTHCGVDIGLTGAIAVIRGGKVVGLYDMPVTEAEGAERRDYSIVGIKCLVQQLQLEAGTGKIIFTIEKAIARPVKGVFASGSLYRGLAIFETVLVCRNIGCVTVWPATWKKEMVPGKRQEKNDKERSVKAAVELFPEVAEALKRVKDHNRGEAVLLAEYGRRIS